MRANAFAVSSPQTWFIGGEIAPLSHKKSEGTRHEKTNTKVLVAYDSKLGSTAEVAKFIGSVLSEQGASIAVKPLSEAVELETYDSVIFGSAIRYDPWLPDATTFVREKKTVLSNLPVSFLFTCLTDPPPVEGGACPAVPRPGSAGDTSIRPACTQPCLPSTGQQYAIWSAASRKSYPMNSVAEGPPVPCG